MASEHRSPTIAGFHHVVILTTSPKEVTTRLTNTFGFSPVDSYRSIMAGFQIEDTVLRSGRAFVGIREPGPRDTLDDQHVMMHGTSVRELGLLVTDDGPPRSDVQPAGERYVPWPDALRMGVRLKYVQPNESELLNEDIEIDNSEAALGIVDIDHIAVAVHDNTTTAFASELEPLGFRQDPVEPVGGRIIEAGGSAFRLTTLTAGHSSAVFAVAEPIKTERTGQIAKFITNNNGPGVHHIAFGVEDIFQATEALRTNGGSTLPVSADYYAAGLNDCPFDLRRLQDSNVLYDTDQYGFLFQTFTTSFSELNTTIVELIERQGARSFGDRNVTALYAAEQSSL